MLENEKAFGRTPEEVREDLLALWQVMRACVTRGCTREGLLPGGLKRRRAPQLHRQLSTEKASDPLHAMDWVTLFALAVNEENAAMAASSPPPPMAPRASSRLSCITTTASCPATTKASSASC